MKKRALDRDERKRQIMLFMRIQTEKDANFICSAVDIAKGIGLVQSAHVRSIVGELVQDNLLTKCKVTGHGAVKEKNLYLIAPGVKREWRRPRSIVIKRPGHPPETVEIEPVARQDELPF